ncbi:MAG: FxLYD domain-containing protein [Candidatus Binatia bacterium]
MFGSRAAVGFVALLWLGGNVSVAATPPTIEEGEYAERVALTQTRGEWTSMGFLMSDLLNSTASNSHRGMYLVTGRVQNIGSGSLHHVKLKFELLDQQGEVVAREIGYNRGAEDLQQVDLPPGSGETITVESRIRPIGSGESDSFRMIFLGSEAPAFDALRVEVIEVSQVKDP